MKLILLLAATIHLTQPWWIFSNFFCNYWHRYPFLQRASCDARKEFIAITKNSTLTRGQREDALQQWATKNDLVDAYNSYKNATDMARAKKYEAIANALINLPKIFQELEAIQTNLNFTIGDERAAVEKLCSSIGRQQRAAVNYLMLLYASTKRDRQNIVTGHVMDEVTDDVLYRNLKKV